MKDVVEETEETEEKIVEEEEEDIEESEEEVTPESKGVEEILEERIYTIPLGKAWISPRKKRAPRAIHLVKNYIQRHMKPETLVIDNRVNETIWSRGIEKPPRRIRVRAVKDQEGTVTIRLAED